MQCDGDSFSHYPISPHQVCVCVCVISISMAADLFVDCVECSNHGQQNMSGHLHNTSPEREWINALTVCVCVCRGRPVRCGFLVCVCV